MTEPNKPMTIAEVRAALEKSRAITQEQRDVLEAFGKVGEDLTGNFSAITEMLVGTQERLERFFAPSSMESRHANRPPPRREATVTARLAEPVNLSPEALRAIEEIVERVVQRTFENRDKEVAARMGSSQRVR